MPAKDKYHNNVKNTLLKDGWTITHDPLRLVVGKKDLYVDFGAERLLTAEKGMRKIAVEVKTFTGRSDMNDLQQAIGQYVLYCDVLSVSEPDRELFVAISGNIYYELFEAEPIGKLVLDKGSIRLVVFDPAIEEIQLWKP